jgi:hypothetical protein
MDGVLLRLPSIISTPDGKGEELRCWWAPSFSERRPSCPNSNRRPPNRIRHQYQSWYHPRGGHLFSVFPWSHLIFTEKAQIRWRSDFKTDGATRFSEVAGGPNQMSIARFERLVAQSPFRFESFRTIPIRPLAWAHNRLTREFTTAALECKLVKRRHG